MIVEDILRNIVYRLSIQDLDNCKFVNNEYHSLITDPEFKDDKRRVMGDNAILSIYAYDHAHFEVYGIHCDGAKQELTSPLEDDRNANRPIVLGSCNGLIGIKYYQLDYMLWNPVTQECLTYEGGAPTLLIDPTAVGLCYKASSDEYMAVVVGTIRCYSTITSCIELINFSTNDSKCVNWQTGNVAFDLNGVGMVVCGVPHWVKEYDNDNVDDLWDRKRIFFFDTKNETFNEMNLPGQVGKEEKRILGLGALIRQSQLSIVLRDMKNPNLSYDVWVMKEYGNLESWT
ncbi:hypothetical protein RND81_13G142000 [Saponaria officinalis]|uniref:F-box domain-containing protein n=1 Tax=Saponaria officinalis TaxID=3572 RepID=A0AAW1H1B0_SAPOF